MRLRLVALLLILPALAIAAPSARAATEVILDAAALTQLEQRATAAEPREQCFLYTELVHHLTELAGRQIADGDNENASATLRRVETLTDKIHVSLARDAKRLKNAEMLLHHTSRRLLDILHVAASDDRPSVQATLAKLDAVQSEILTQVFQH